MDPTFKASNTVFFLKEYLYDNLNIEAPPAQIVELAIARLSKQIKEDLESKREKIFLKNIKKTKGTLRSLERCNNNLFKYMSQERENAFVVTLEFEQLEYIICINKKGKVRYVEL
ncbi:MAG: hypothetical protein H0U27_07820 [Nitrosopumilus sp.]|nr:hypothetical protein [Nitrosopumilus sp.]